MQTASPVRITTLTLALVAAATAAGSQTAVSADAHAHPAPARLVQLVREATRPFLDITQAGAAGYGPFLGCVSGPQSGAMGQHFVNPSLVGDGALDAAHPEALIYEFRGERAELVGVEYIVDAATWLAAHDGPPVLEGQSFQLVGSPNRYALPAFFELHVWAWRDNPNGTFADWHARVHCDGHPGMP
ncbi:MAG: hypothetical protein R2712_26255 [Vicinamibacterales bacterium]